MINVQYPFLDLTQALLALLKTLKPTDWAKTTLFKNYKINGLAKDLVQIHVNILTKQLNAFTLNIGEIDTVADSASIKESCESLAHLLENNNIVFELDEKEYAYCWLLQQYIRQALNNQDLLVKAFYFPFLNTVMQNFAGHYQRVEANEDVIVKVEIVGEAGGIWSIEKSAAGWTSVTEHKPATVTIYLDQQIAWLLFTNALHVSEIGQFYQLIGNKQLGSYFLNMRTNIAVS
ncbi:hypothetical protein [Pedobacter arcticus]|uniref:hypothetical protein n=1 Tax=Pedobacter arcticus TaxID=752140 RepID=UPI0002E20E67|nr:hypothetical protein [Pedobacter arcticus]